MLIHPVLVTNGETRSTKAVESFLEKCLDASFMRANIAVARHTLSDGFSHDTEVLLQELRNGARGLIFVSQLDGLWRHPIRTFIGRIRQAVPPINLLHTSCALITDCTRSNDSRALASSITDELARIHAEVYPTAFGVTEGGAAIHRMVEEALSEVA